MNFSLNQWGPERTPLAIKHLIIWTSFIAITSAFLQDLCDLLSIFPGPQYLLSLSWWGLSTGYFWEPVTFLFVQGPPGTGITFNFLITLVLNMYLLWVIGAQIVDLVGGWSFVKFYFVVGILSGLFTILITKLAGYGVMIAGSTPIILGLLTLWSMLFPENEVWIFNLISAKIKWVVVTILAVMLLSALLQGNLSSFLHYIIAVAMTYKYAVMGWGWNGPFAFLKPIDNILHSFSRWMRNIVPGKEKGTDDHKIIDIQTKRPLDTDEAFVDAMLAKISKSGEDSLSWGEKRRLQSISEKRMRRK